MVGGKGALGTSRFIRRLRMCRALGIQYSRAMPPASRTRGRDRRRGTWWNLEKHCVAIEGKDFAQDTQEGGADQFELIPDSEEGGDNGPSLLGGDDEFVPETEPQDNAAVSKARPRLGFSCSSCGSFKSNGRPTSCEISSPVNYFVRIKTPMMPSIIVTSIHFISLTCSLKDEARCLIKRGRTHRKKKTYHQLAGHEDKNLSTLILEDAREETRI